MNTPVTWGFVEMYGKNVEELSFPSSLPCTPTTHKHYVSSNKKKKVNTLTIQKNKNLKKVHNDMKYLIKKYGLYYLNFRYNNKNIQYSLKSDDLFYCNILKYKIVKIINMNLDDLKIKNHYSVNFSLDIKPDYSKGETDEIAEKMAKKVLNKMTNINTNNMSSDIIKIKTSSDNAMTLKEATEKFINNKILKNKVSKATVNKYHGTFKYLFLLKDKDTQITKMTSKFFKDMQNILINIPVNYFKYKKYKEVPLNDVLKIDVQKIANKTINVYFIILKDLFEYLVYEEYIDINPVTVKPLQEEDSGYIEYTDKEIEKLLNIKDVSILNIIKMGLYTGMRIGEIAELKKIDISENCFNIQHGKTKNSKRQIPIHQELKDIVDHNIKYNDSEFLFLNGNKNIMTKKMSKVLKTLIPIPKKSFHSLRKNFIQKLHSHKPKLDYYVINNLSGHTTKDLNFNVYNRGKLDINDLTEAINSVKY